MTDSLTSRQPVVFLVGAGPGDPALITVRGKELISMADTIIYDYLASDLLLDKARPDAELIFVGKQSGRHTIPQEEINALIVQKARENKMVVRLKGGDPFVFGRGGEEALTLNRADIPFEIVPGITAGIAAPAYAGIPVTHRDFASDFALITGHEAADRTGDSQIDWPALGKWKGTLAFYMGVKNLPNICARLIENGMKPDTPSALIQWGCTPRQRTLTATLDSLPDLAAEKKFTPPAIILIGQVVQLHDHLAWFENKPLFGQTVLVTRARAQASSLVHKLRALGADTIEYPTIKIVPPQDPQPLIQAVKTLDEFDWIVFTSVNAVQAFFRCLHQQQKDSRALHRAKICAIGPATAHELSPHGITPDLVPPRYVAESVFDAIRQIDSLSDKAILLPRSALARPDLPQALTHAGARVTEVTAYETVADSGNQEEVMELIANNLIDWITFTSSSTARNFFQQIPSPVIKNSRTKMASIGPITSQTIFNFNIAPDIEAAEYTIDGLIKAITGIITPLPPL